MKTSKLILGMLGAAALVTSYSAVCAERFPEKNGYLIDTPGNIVRNCCGECWRTGTWTPDKAIEDCDPGLVKKEQAEEAEPALPAPVPLVSSESKQPAAPETPREKLPPPVPEEPATAVAAQEKPAIEVYFNAETLFDFDKAVIKPEGRKILDEKIVTGMQMYPEVALLIITGHADRIGTEEYNQDLSERRANAVKAYLVKQGIAAERMRASGKGETEPNPEANTRQACKGMRGNKLIACLQPDRRVTVESQGRTPVR